MGRTLLPSEFGEQLSPRPFTLRDEFPGPLSATWTAVLAGSATAGVGLAGSPGKGLDLETIDSVANREVYVRQTQDTLTLGARSPVRAECSLMFTEAHGNSAAVMFGLMSAVGAGSIQDNTGEPKASFSGAVIYKVPGGTQWKTCSSVGTVQSKAQSDTPASPDSAFHRLTIEIAPLDSTLCEVSYFVDGDRLKTAGGRPGFAIIKDRVSYAGAVLFGAAWGLKNGADGFPQILQVNYVSIRGMQP